MLIKMFYVFLFLCFTTKKVYMNKNEEIIENYFVYILVLLLIINLITLNALDTFLK